VAVMISGSGPQDRDESIMGHSPFLVLADHLARQGIATLRYDDRGFGESTGEFSTALTSDFATDALAAVGWLRDRDDIDDSAIGLIGHSEGGLVAPMAIVEDPTIAFAVLMAGPGVDGGRILTSQSERIMKVQGTDAVDIEKIIVLHAEMMDLVRNDAPVEELGAGYLALIGAQIATARSKLGDEQADQMLADGRAKLAADPQPFTPWMVAFIRTDPREFLSQLSCPVLAINGTHDVQVISELNLPEIDRAVTTGGGTIKVIEYESLNHLFQKSETGAVTEYSTIETTMEPEVLMDISTWILEVTRRSGS
jgi:pimeloyl-ACP methyl ester carboxylesterase